MAFLNSVNGARRAKLGAALREYRELLHDPLSLGFTVRQGDERAFVCLCDVVGNLELPVRAVVV